MAETTEISWADATFNPWEGCQKVGPGCDHCYAETRNARYNGTAVNWGPGASRRKTSASNWAKPLKWNREAAASGVALRVFCSSLADVFDNAVPDEWRAELADLIRKTPNLIWMLLTKRIGNALAMLRAMFPEGVPGNVWLGMTVVNQEEATRDRHKMKIVKTVLKIRITFLSIEPMLGRIDLCEYFGMWWQQDQTGAELPGDPVSGRGKWVVPPFDSRTVDWVICGGESGAGARPLHPAWVRHLRDMCKIAGVPFHFKQWGEYEADEIGREDRRSIDYPTGHVEFRKVGKKAAGNKFEGVTYQEFPT